MVEPPSDSKKTGLAEVPAKNEASAQIICACELGNESATEATRIKEPASAMERGVVGDGGGGWHGLGHRGNRACTGGRGCGRVRRAYTRGTTTPLPPGCRPKLDAAPGETESQMGRRSKFQKIGYSACKHR